MTPSEDRQNEILSAAKVGGYLGVAVTLLTADLKQTDDLAETAWIVAENYYGHSILAVMSDGKIQEAEVEQ